MSKYLLCEDSKGGFIFWEKVNGILLDNYFDVVDHSGGFGGLPRKVKDAITAGASYIFVAVDEVPKSAVTIKKVKDLLLENNVEFALTDYWCIEEVLLSFTQLPEWTKAKPDLTNIWEQVYNNVIGSAEARVPVDIQDALIQITGGKRVEKEKFYKRLYGTLVDTKHHQFSINKRDEGTEVYASCWFNDCFPAMIASGCKEICGVPDEMTRAYERLLCLYKNSLLISREFGTTLHTYIIT